MNNGSTTQPVVEAEPLAVQPVTDAHVRLVASARFFSETLVLPPGVTGRDREGFIESEVEELSVFPLETTAWGYMSNDSDKANISVLIYAASRDQVKKHIELTPCYAVLPGFSVLTGLRMKQTTWMVLVEDDCVTLARIPAKASAPDLVRSRYGTNLKLHPDRAWELRKALLESVKETADGVVEEGLLRCAGPIVERSGVIRFPLEQQLSVGAGWRHYRTGRLGRDATLLTADVRDKQLLSEERARRAAVGRLRVIVRVAAVICIALAVFQYRYWAKKHDLANLEQQVLSQRPAVKALKEQESLADSVAKLSQAPLEIFEWLSAVNAQRPESMAFHTVYADRDGTLGFNGEAPSVLVVNQYREALEKSGRFRTVEVTEINSVKRGVTFSIRVKLDSDVESEGAS
jgi:hypothetical protein